MRNVERLGRLVYAECFRAWRRHMHTRRRRERAVGSLLKHWHKDGGNLKHRFQRWRDLCRDKYHGDSPLDTALNRQRALELVNGRLKQRLADDTVTISAMRVRRLLAERVFCWWLFVEWLGFDESYPRRAC